MRKICLAALFMAFVFTGLCLADEVRGKVAAVDKAKKTVQISGVIIKAGEAWIEDEQDYPLAANKLRRGDFVEVEGKFTGLSEMRANKIDKKQLECGAVGGKIDSIDPQKRKLIISGIAVKVPAAAWLEGPNRVRIPLELFAPGYSVDCRGEWTGPSELTAFKITVD